MRKLLFSLTTLLFLAAGCSNDDSVDNGAVTPVAQKRTITSITASMEGADTRTQLVKGNHVVWDDDDEIILFADQTGGDFAYYKISSGWGTSTATFEGDALTGTNFYAIYPDFADWEWNDNNRLMIPWRYFDNVIFGDNNCNHYIPMFAKETNGTLEFQQLGGALHFQVTGTDYLQRATLRSNTDFSYFPSYFEVDFSGATPTLSEAVDYGGDEEMYGDACMNLSDTPLDIYFILPAGMTFKDGFTLTLEVSDEKDNVKVVEKSSYQGFTITRGQINAYPAFDFDKLYEEQHPTPLEGWKIWSGEEIWGSGVYATITSTSDYMTKFAFFDKEDYGGSILATLSVFDLGLDDIPDGEPVWRSSWEFEFYKNKSYYTSYRVEGSASNVITLGRVGDVYGISFTFDTHVAVTTGEELGGGGFQWSGTLVNVATPMSVGDWSLSVTNVKSVSGNKYRVMADKEYVQMECFLETPGFYDNPQEVYLVLDWATINSVVPGEAIQTSEYKMDFWRGEIACCLDGQTPMTLGISEDGAYYIIIDDFTYTTWNDNGDEIEVEHGGSFTWTGDFGDNVEWSY